MPGISNHSRSACEPPEPISRATSRPAISRQLWLSGMMSSRVSGLKAVACQLWPPAVLGHTDTQSPMPASAMSCR